MSHYVFTSNALAEGGVYTLNSDTGRVRRRLKGSFRGITEGPDGCLYVVSGSRNPRKDTSEIHRIQPTRWETEKIAVHPVKDSHDLKWIRGHFYLVASVGNQILKLDAEGNLVSRMQIVPDERDICHVNCLAEQDGHLYATVFTLSPGSRREKNQTGLWHTEGKLLRLDFEAGHYETLHEPLCQPHSLVPDGGGFYLVESHTSRVVRIGSDWREKRVVGQYTGFLRGLAFSGGERVLGTCVMYVRDRRRMRPLPWLLNWKERLFPFAGLYILNEAWQVKRRVRLDGAEVYDVLPLPEQFRQDGG